MFEIFSLKFLHIFSSFYSWENFFYYKLYLFTKYIYSVIDDE